MKTAVRFLMVCTTFSILIGCSMIDPWQETKSRDTIYSYEMYLREHPKSEHITEAKNRIETMQFIEVSKEENVSQNEYRIKSLSVLKDIQNGYERFLRDYPKSDLSTKARSRLEELKEEERQYKAALNDSVSGDVSVFLAFLKTHKRYGFTDLLNNLQQIGDENCVKSLGSLLTWYNNMARQKTYPISVSGMVFLGPSSDGQTRIDIISALRSTGKKSAIPYIIMSLDDPEKAVETYGVNYSRGPTGPATYYYPVRQAAAEALKKMTGYDFGFDQARWEKWLENKGQ